MTRRLKKPRLRIGGIYSLRVGHKLLSDKIKVLRIYPQRLGEMSEEDARREGFESLEEFKRAWITLYRRWDDGQQIWVVEFRYMGERFKD